MRFSDTHGRAMERGGCGESWVTRRCERCGVPVDRGYRRFAVHCGGARCAAYLAALELGASRAEASLAALRGAAADRLGGRVTAPDIDAIEAIEARAAAAGDNLRRVRAMHQAAPPEGCDDGDRTPALERVVASLAGGYSTLDLDARDVRCLVVAFDDAEQIIDSLQGQAALLRGETHELRAKVADLTGDYEAGCDETRRLGDELTRLRAHIAAEPERVAAAVDAATAAEQDIAHDVVWYAMLHHPLPWRVERDWTHEVTAKDGTIIAKCMTHGRAAAIVALAEAIVADLATDECADAIAATGGR